MHVGFVEHPLRRCRGGCAAAEPVSGWDFSRQGRNAPGGSETWARRKRDLKRFAQSFQERTPVAAVG